MENIPQEGQIPENSIPVSGGSPYFLGDNALVQFSSGDNPNEPVTHWLVDKSNRTLRPFESDGALQNAFGEQYPLAVRNVVKVAPPTLDESGGITDGVLRDFNILGPEYAIKEDGTTKNVEFSPHQLRGRYGKPIDENAEGLATEAVDGFLNLLRSKSGSTNLDPNFINKLRQDQQLMAFYVSALAYGGYTLSDLYKDIVQRNQKQGSQGEKV